jgi:hypothetical protein
MTRYTLESPAPGHRPTVGRRRTGTTMAGGQTYGTTLQCSCGWSPGKISNAAPSAGGKAAARDHYREHLWRERVTP